MTTAQALSIDLDGVIYQDEEPIAGASEALAWVFRLLMANPSAVLIALGTTRYWRAADGLRLDAGPFVAALEHAAGRRALVLGKPAPQFFHTAAGALRCHPAEIVMVGDDIAADVRGSQEAGMRGVLVRTGKFREADLTSDTRPDGILPSFADLPAWWVQRNRE